MDKKELKKQYLQTKIDMGVYIFECLPSGKKYVGYSPNVKGKINSLNLQLKTGTCVYKTLQQDWQRYGAENFHIYVAELLDYDEDESKSDYGEDLDALRTLYCENLTNYEYLERRKKF